MNFPFQLKDIFYIDQMNWFLMRYGCVLSYNIKLVTFKVVTPEIQAQWLCIFGVTSLKMTSLRVTSLSYVH